MTSTQKCWICGILAAILALTESNAAAEPKSKSEQWRNDNACGVNCVYVLMRLNNLKIGYDALSDRLLGGERETSLLDLQKVSGDYGLQYETGRSTPEGLQSAKGAVICHTENPMTGKGHFVLVLRADKEGVVAMDGTTCVLRRFDWSTFRSTWSGFVLFPKGAKTLPTTEVGTFAVGFAATWGCLSLVPRLRRRQQ